MKRYFDELETRAEDQRESNLLSALPKHIAHAKAKSSYFAQLLQNVEPSEIDSRRALARLPVTRKAQLVVGPLGELLSYIDRRFLDNLAQRVRQASAVIDIPAESFEQRRYEVRAGLRLVISRIEIVGLIAPKTVD